jgi:succinate dehydrogenase/fumarate reductase flavoprotein subunit
MQLESIKWDEETDVVVLGCGGGGAVAAITAWDAGAKVVLIEKGEGGGNTRLATMAYVCPTDTAAAREHIKAISFGMVSDEIIDVYVKWSSTNNDYIKQLGGEVESCLPGASFPQVAGAETMLRFRVKAKTPGELGGTSLWNLLAENLGRRKIPIHRQTTAKKIFRSRDHVVGVAVEKEDQLSYIRTRKGVVLATGGFEYNEELKREYLGGYPIFSYGNPANTGDGIKIAPELGADLWHMRAVAAPMGYKVPEFQSSFSMCLLADGFIIVDQNGERFCNETGLEHYSMWMAVTAFDMESVRFSRIPCYVIFDEPTRLKGPITRVGHGANRSYLWSQDNLKEIREGWIVASDSASELAAKLGIKNGARLHETVESYRGACAAGVDEKFGRAQKTLAGLNGKLYGIAL